MQKKRHNTLRHWFQKKRQFIGIVIGDGGVFLKRLPGSNNQSGKPGNLFRYYPERPVLYEMMCTASMRAKIDRSSPDRAHVRPGIQP